MYRALDVASEQLTLCIGDQEHLAKDAERIFVIQHIDERKAQAIDWADEQWEARRPLEMRELFELATRLFNRSLKRAQISGERLGEKEATYKAIEQTYYRRTNDD